MAASIVVTGATGNVGLEVCRALQQMGIPFRAADVKMETVYQRLGDDTQAALFRFGEETTYAETFTGAKAVFLMRPPQIIDVKRYMFPAIDAAVAAGVEHFVFLSLIGIEQNTIVPHYKVEQYLRKSGAAFTFLRASFFMQNLNTTHRAEVRDRDELFIPAGKSRTSFIDVRDISAVAAVALTQPGHENKAYDLTGPEELDYWQVADLFSEVLGRKITYRNPSILSFIRKQLAGGTPLTYALVMAFLYNNTRNGMAAVITSEVERLTGRKPIRLEQYMRDYRGSWMR